MTRDFTHFVACRSTSNIIKNNNQNKEFLRPVKGSNCVTGSSSSSPCLCYLDSKLTHNQIGTVQYKGAGTVWNAIVIFVVRINKPSNVNFITSGWMRPAHSIASFRCDRVQGSSWSTVCVSTPPSKLMRAALNFGTHLCKSLGHSESWLSGYNHIGSSGCGIITAS